MAPKRSELSSSLECFFCKQTKNPTKDIKVPVFPCDVCRRYICADCSELDPAEVKCIGLQNRILLYKCKHCRYEMIDSLQSTIKDKDLIISMLQEQIELLKMEGSKTQEHINTYSEITRNSSFHEEPKDSFPKIIIKPKSNQDPNKTRTDVNNSVNPLELKVGIQNIRTTSKGNVIIKCQTKQQTEKLKETVQDKLKQKYEVILTKMRKPTIKIVNFNQNMTEDEIEECIKQQNNLCGASVTYIRQNKNLLKTIFCECSPSAFVKVMKMKKLYIGWERYLVYENLEILRCFRCQSFYHKQKDCKNLIACSICSENHDEVSCPKTKKCCCNCLTANNRYKMDHDINHSPTDLQCPSLKYHIDILKSKTDYLNE